MMSNVGPAFEVSGTLFTVTFGDTRFAVDAAKAGRIVSFSLGGKNILTAPKNSEDNNWGSTFWTSPQSDWNWPPPAEIDPGPHVARVAGSTLVVESPVAPNLGLAVRKTFSADPGKGMVTVDYGIANRGTSARKAAPWEISRVATGGLTFFPMGEGKPWKGFQELLPLDLRDGVAWFPAPVIAAANDQKVFADGREGWIAHVMGDLLFVKAFADTGPAQAAPGESEIELYTDPGRTYVEVENQGAFVDLQPGQSSAWPVRWFLRKLDPKLKVAPGSAELLGVVRALLK
jgi:hypothetical protein